MNVRLSVEEQQTITLAFGMRCKQREQTWSEY